MEPNSTNWKDLLTVQQAAEFVGCSVNFIRIRVRNGSLKVYRLGKLYRFHPDDLKTLVKVTGDAPIIE